MTELLPLTIDQDDIPHNYWINASLPGPLHPPALPESAQPMVEHKDLHDTQQASLGPAEFGLGIISLAALATGVRYYIRRRHKRRWSEEMQQRRAEEAHQRLVKLGLRQRDSAQYEALLQDPEVVQAVVDFAPGRVIPLTEPEAPVTKERLEKCLKDHFRLLGETIFRASQIGSNPEIIVPYLWSYWSTQTSKRGFADRLSPRFWGQIRNVRLLFLPIDEEFVEKYLDNPDEVSPKDMARVCIIVDLKSTGRPAQSSLMDSVVYLRNSEEKGPIMMTSLRGRSTGEQVVEYLKLESANIARRVEASALRRAFPGGLPGLGKRR